MDVGAIIHDDQVQVNDNNNRQLVAGAEAQRVFGQDERPVKTHLKTAHATA